MQDIELKNSLKRVSTENLTSSLYFMPTELFKLDIHSLNNSRIYNANQSNDLYFIKRHYPIIENRNNDHSEVALLGFIPSWAYDANSYDKHSTVSIYTINNKPVFRNALLKAQFCCLSVSHFHGYIWHDGQVHTVRIEHVDRQPFLLAGIWSEWKSDTQNTLLSFALLTRNYDNQISSKAPHSQYQCYVVLENFNSIDFLNLSFEEILFYFATLEPSNLRVTKLCYSHEKSK